MGRPIMLNCLGWLWFRVHYRMNQLGMVHKWVGPWFGPVQYVNSTFHIFLFFNYLIVHSDLIWLIWILKTDLICRIIDVNSDLIGLLLWASVVKHAVQLGSKLAQNYLTRLKF